jgi:hypothetical protein
MTSSDTQAEVKTAAVKPAAKPVAKPAAKPAVKVAANQIAKPTAAVQSAAVKIAPKVPPKVAQSVAAKVPPKHLLSSAPVAKPAPKKEPKLKKPKMIRDSLTMPKVEYAVLSELKARADKLNSPVKKTELIRAGIKAISAMSDAAFLASIKAIPSLKTGRPKKSK